MRKARRSLCVHERAAANRHICNNLQRLPAFTHAKTIAAYLAFDGEPSVSALFDDVRNATKRFLVPVIRAQQMKFAPLSETTTLRTNRFGISEPSHHIRERTRSIDVVLVPLVGFDESGNRLGMGGGFYDRHFSFLRTRSIYFRPRLIGVAYELQHIGEIPAEPWDVPLSGIVTEQRLITIRRKT